jgi:hypothetical protein
MSLTAKHQVINAAMAHMGEPGFESILTDPPGATLSKVLGQLDGVAGVEQFALSRHPWLCALRYATLAPVSSPPANWKWSRLFQLPDTFVKLWVLDGADIPYEVGTETFGSPSPALRKVIRCNEASIRVAYTERLAYEAYTPDLCNYIALELAGRTMGPLKSDYEGAARLRQAAEAALAAAESGEAGQHADEEGLVTAGLNELRATI